jgi:hypothetical protein
VKTDTHPTKLGSIRDSFDKAVKQCKQTKLSAEVIKATELYSNISDEERQAIYDKQKTNEEANKLYDTMKSAYGEQFNITREKFRNLTGAELLMMDNCVRMGLANGALKQNRPVKAATAKKEESILEQCLRERGWSE